MLPYVAVLGLAIARNFPQRILVAAVYSAASFVANGIIKSIDGPTVEEKHSAAQFPEK